MTSVPIVSFNLRLSRDMTKPTRSPERPAKSQISLGIRLVWSVFAVRITKRWVLSFPLRAQRRLWSDWADAQAGPSLRWAHMPLFICISVLFLTLSRKTKLQQKKEKKKENILSWRTNLQNLIIQSLSNQIRMIRFSDYNNYNHFFLLSLSLSSTAVK